MKVTRELCKRCNEPAGDHTRSMQLVASQSAPPKPGFGMNLYQCMEHGGFKPIVATRVRELQQGEGRNSSSQKQFS